MNKLVISLLSIFILSLFLISEFNTVAYSDIPLPLKMAVNEEIATLWEKSPTGTYAFYEAKSIPNSYWLDDNSKFLEAIASYWNSYSTYVDDILQFLQEGDVGGYFIKRFEYPFAQFYEKICGDLIGYTNGYYWIWYNQSNTLQGLRVSTYYNPTLTVAYLQSVVIQEPNGILVNPCEATENPIVDGGFSGSGGQNPPWELLNISAWGNDTKTSLDNSAKTYLNLTGPALFGTPSEQLQYNYPIVNVLPQAITLIKGTKYLGQTNPNDQFMDFNITLYIQSSSINRIYLIFVWENASGSFIQTNIPVYFTADGQWQDINVPIPNSVYPKYWNLGTLSAYPFLIGIGIYVPGATSTQTRNTGIYVASISTLYPTTYAPQFNVIKTQNYVAFNYTFTSNSGSQYWWAYLLQKNNMILALAEIQNGSTLYFGFNGLSTIGSGYQYMFTQKFGYIKNYQDSSNISWTYFANVNIGQWLLLNTSYAPNWIGDYNLLFIFPLANYTEYNSQFGHFGPYTVYFGPPYEIRNTLYMNSTFETPAGYYQWFQIAYEGNGTSLVGFDFIPSVDWIPCPNTVVKNILDGPSYWKYAIVGEDYYEGQIIYALALLGKYGNTQALSMAEQSWQAYYNELKWSNGKTYTSSLARFILATIVLYNTTHNSIYLDALNQLGSWLLQYQSSNRYTYYNISMWYHKDNYVTNINGYNTYGYIINTTSGMDVGTVISGSSIAINFFEDIPLNTSYAIRLYNKPYKALLPPTLSNDLNVSGILTTILYFNGGGTDTEANVTITVQIAYNGQVLQTIGSSIFTNVQIQAGGKSGSTPYYPVTFHIPVLTNVEAPSGSTLIVGINVKAPQKVYMLVDSTNGPSNVTIPFSWPNPFYGLFTIPKLLNPIIKYPMSNYCLDVTSMSGQALMSLYYLTHNQTYLTHALMIEQGLHYSEEPFLNWSDMKGNISINYRIWIYYNYSTIQSDYDTYMDELLSEYADAIGNQTLADLAISRMWERTTLDYPYYMAYYVSDNRTDGQINSETQPWGIVAEEDYIQAWDYPKIQLFYANFSNGNYLENQTWNGSALILHIYAHYPQNLSLYFLTGITNFNIFINGQAFNYRANHELLQFTANLKIGQNTIIIIAKQINTTTTNTSTTLKSSLNFFPISIAFIVGISLLILFYLAKRSKK
ncbi:end-filament protein [Acidianus manzaensis]|nr:end-filament protein [Acidianus manzaensis]